MRPSDVDLLIFAGDKDENERRYQKEYGAEDKYLQDDLKEWNRVRRFVKRSNFEKVFKRGGDGIIVRMPELKAKIKEICAKLPAELPRGQKMPHENLLAAYNATRLFGSDSAFQNKSGLEAEWRNEILEIILQNPGG